MSPSVTPDTLPTIRSSGGGRGGVVIGIDEPPGSVVDVELVVVWNSGAWGLVSHAVPTTASVTINSIQSLDMEQR